VIAEVLFEDMPKQKEQGIERLVERLVVGRGRDTAFHCKKGEVFPDIN